MKIWMGVIWHKHGQNSYVDLTKDSLYRQLRKYVKKWWRAWPDLAGKPCPKDPQKACDQYFGVTDFREGLSVWDDDLITDDKLRQAVLDFAEAMLAEYKLRSGDLFSDVDKVPQMLVKGKLALLPPGGGEVREVRAIFERAEEEKDTK